MHILRMSHAEGKCQFLAIRNEVFPVPSFGDRG